MWCVAGGWVLETGGGGTNIWTGEGKEKSRRLPASWFGGNGACPEQKDQGG